MVQKNENSGKWIRKWNWDTSLQLVTQWPDSQWFTLPAICLMIWPTSDVSRTLEVGYHMFFVRWMVLCNITFWSSCQYYQSCRHRFQHRVDCPPNRHSSGCWTTNLWPYELGSFYKWLALVLRSHSMNVDCCGSLHFRLVRTRLVHRIIEEIVDNKVALGRPFVICTHTSCAVCRVRWCVRTMSRPPRIVCSKWQLFDGIFSSPSFCELNFMYCAPMCESSTSLVL